MPKTKKPEPPNAHESEHLRMFNGTARLRDLVVNQSYPASVPVARLRKVNDLLGQALVMLTAPGDAADLDPFREGALEPQPLKVDGNTYPNRDALKR